MTRLAIRRKSTQDVIWIRGALEVLHMAGGAGSIRCSQIVVVVHMAGSTRHTRVSAGQRKPRGVMVKIGFKPRIHSVASLAVHGKARRDVIGRNRILKIPRMAGVAFRR